MAFRSGEAAASGFEEARHYLVPRGLSERAKIAADDALQRLSADLGPAIDAYPTWHPLVAQQSDPGAPQVIPSRECGYEGLDHTRYFAHGFITCPYDGGRKVLNSVKALPNLAYAQISAERLDVSFYSEQATTIVVRCDWRDELGPAQTIPSRLALPLMMGRELLAWPGAERAESWETMRPYLLGQPHGARSSLFVDQDTAMMLKETLALLNKSGMFGPLKE